VRERSSWGLREGDEILPGRYATSLLGGGRRYEAYLAWDEAMHTLVVAKLVRPALVDSDSARRGLVGEASALGSLSHPAIVRMFDVVLDGERPHIVLEHLDGPRLSTLSRRYRIIVEQLLPLALELCSGLHYMHGKRFLHLDVKPRNVVMSGRPKLIDLSLAAPFDAVSSFKRHVGTSAYMAPEQCDAERFAEIGPSSDMWGLGVTMYEALTRTLPFPRGDPSPEASLVERYPQLEALPFGLPKEVPETVAELILWCLETTPSERPTARELAEALEPLVADLPTPRLGLFRAGWRARRSAGSRRTSRLPLRPGR
jgi:eukaryotic-like serine/threonine-protein kinase